MLDFFIEHLKWASVLSGERLEPLAFSPFTLYSKHFAHFLLVLSAIYGARARGVRSFHCNTFHSVLYSAKEKDSNFLEKMCLMPSFGSHALHPGTEDLQPGTIRFDFYTWLYITVVLHFAIATLPYLIFKYWQNEKIESLTSLWEIVPQFRPLAPPTSDFEKVHTRDSLTCSRDHIDLDLNQEGNDPKAVEARDTALIDDFNVIFELQCFFSDSTGHKVFVLDYFKAQLMTLATLLMQIFSLNTLFHGLFLDYGLAALCWMLGIETDAVVPYDLVFPYFSTCHFQAYGVSGTAEELDNLCFMKLNYYNRYIFIVLWFAYWILLIFMALATVYQIAFIFLSPYFRSKVVQEGLQVVDILRDLSITASRNSKWNTNEIFEREITRKGYYWTLVMLEFTSLKSDVFRKLHLLRQTLFAIDADNRFIFSVLFTIAMTSKQKVARKRLEAQSRRQQRLKEVDALRFRSEQLFEIFNRSKEVEMDLKRWKRKVKSEERQDEESMELSSMWRDLATDPEGRDFVKVYIDPEGDWDSEEDEDEEIEETEL